MYNESVRKDGRKRLLMNKLYKNLISIIDK
jgi:hypothetical protein